jgi:hypothetical protein
MLRNSMRKWSYTIHIVLHRSCSVISLSLDRIPLPLTHPHGQDLREARRTDGVPSRYFES